MGLGFLTNTDWIMSSVPGNWEVAASSTIQERGREEV
jgi:hypothetical protein